MSIFSKLSFVAFLVSTALPVAAGEPVSINMDPDIAERVKRTQEGTTVTDNVTETFLEHFDFGRNKPQEPQDRTDDEDGTAPTDNNPNQPEALPSGN